MCLFKNFLKFAVLMEVKNPKQSVEDYVHWILDICLAVMACAGPIMYDYAGMQKQITDY